MTDGEGFVVGAARDPRRRAFVVGALVVEATVWAILWRFDALEWMWHVPVLLAAWLTLRAVQPGEGRRTPVFWLGGTMLLVSAATFMSGGAVVAAVVAVWVLLTMVASLLLRSARARPDRGR